jgi:CheY-like chemotaxis protein/HPt (histidine-containing phosphotransfer) domain-containing protein
VLVADDHPLNRKVAAIALRKAGCTVDEAGNGAEAVGMVLADPYDLVFMDCHMPVMDGFEATEKIRRAEPPGRRVPIVAFTAYVANESRTRSQSSGMDAFLAKPVTPDDLRAVLARYVGADVEPATGAGEPRAAAAEGLLRAFGGDRELLASLATVFVRSAADLLARIDAAHREGDLADLAGATHTLAGAVGNFTREAPFLAARRLMESARAGDAGAVSAAREELHEALAAFEPLLIEAAGITPLKDAPPDHASGRARAS